ncbi:MULTISPECIES: Stealth CR1 domain-containing protein [unclassified Campylobacter]|uniref:Stealth CR1 domain-containing protein n=1 Tax=unclassified Campylobacter TaxID=2593542 RepID=UPI0022E9DD29|nr:MULTISPECIES: Stealth CR1 domain-containing protein [unclassified Campylobacter]MDA3079226.1 stealth family protein [Campylobacter sp. CS_NA2]MDA3080471.1 stealth family protein [Campylobacter sp. CS_NA1]MDA3085324.1 stealth family protein [Campylobacter sp. CS_ED1]MDA3090101.1 stealth family protein [Campylobacter sp. CS_ED2]WBR51361.1 Stealth CR1 domain-containing protein [Campylobacter sp. CS_NA3]
MEIDVVIPWVDGSDPEWIEEFNKYCPKNKQIDIRNIRYRDMGLLKYFFRGVEKFAPWVRKVHFITNGQKPQWLNLGAPKLNFVKHSDYIPSEYLPVFSVNPIEDYMYKIKDLSENFVYFNDDFFLTDFVKKEFFFKNGLPCDCAVLNLPRADFFNHLVLNDMIEIHKNFSLYKSIKENFFKWFNYKYGFEILKTLIVLPYEKTHRFYVLTNPHLPQPFKKSTFEEVWQKCGDVLESTMNNKFRTTGDINQWLFRYWQIYSGNFYPQSMKGKKIFNLTNDSNIDEICNIIKNKKYKEICINDGEIDDFEVKMKKIANAFESILPEKSQFEL